MAVKNVTAWLPPSGAGYDTQVSAYNLTDNLGNLLVDNSGNQLVTTTTVILPKNTGIWTAVAKGESSWTNQSIINTGVLDNIVDESGNFVVDESLNFVVDSGTTASGKTPTTWTASGA